MQNRIQSIAVTGVFTALIAVSAFIRIPTPVMPLTMQIFVVLLVPMLIGARRSFIAILIYIFLGLIGLPVFANGGGPAYIFQPTFGFLIGYLFSTIPNAMISNRSDKMWIFVLGGLAGLFVIYVFGVVGFWLSMNQFQGKNMSLPVAAGVVMTPFLIPDFIKLCAAAVISSRLRPAIKNYFPI